LARTVHRIPYYPSCRVVPYTPRTLSVRPGQRERILAHHEKIRPFSWGPPSTKQPECTCNIHAHHTAKECWQYSLEQPLHRAAYEQIRAKAMRQCRPLRERRRDGPSRSRAQPFHRFRRTKAVSCSQTNFATTSCRPPHINGVIEAGALALVFHRYNKLGHDRLL
jgi:hypothetical protein